MNHESARGYVPHLVPIARQLRREMTPAEAVLWKHIRGRRFAGIRFRRQQPVDPYVADFFCAAAKLIVELDGDSHAGKEADDAERQGHLERLGYRVLRFTNPDVYDDLEPVLEAIWAACHQSPIGAGPSPSPPTPLPPGERGAKP